MLEFGRRSVLVFKLVLLLTCGASATDSKPTSADTEVARRIERVATGLWQPIVFPGEVPMKLEDRMRELKVPGVSIAVIHEGKLQWARGFGSTTIGGPPVQTHTLFQAGSISKLVAAVAALALVQEGRLALDADVNLALKSWKVPENSYTSASKVTLRRLLNHSAGVTVHGFPGYENGGSIPSLIEILNGVPPTNTSPIVVDIRPGDRFRYSGGGYTIMQQMLIDVTGKPFAELLDETVLKPLGMTSSTFVQPVPASSAHAVATPYRADGAAVPGGPHIYPELAAAGLWTTPTDLARFALALLDAWAGREGSLLSPSMTTEMMTPGLGSYGLGPVVRGRAPHRSFLHDGVNDGFVNSMVAFEGGEGAIVMTNGMGGRLLTYEILCSIATEYDWPRGQPKMREPKVVDPQALDRLVGDYRLTPQSIIRVSSENGRLFAQITGQANFEVFPESDREFFYKVVDAVLAFDLNDGPKAASVTLRQNGLNRTAMRVP
jgi:CubicO group peptidase (beta-lactamase class C family)